MSIVAPTSAAARVYRSGWRRRNHASTAWGQSSHVRRWSGQCPAAKCGLPSEAAAGAAGTAARQRRASGRDPLRNRRAPGAEVATAGRRAFRTGPCRPTSAAPTSPPRASCRLARKARTRPAPRLPQPGRRDVATSGRGVVARQPVRRVRRQRSRAEAQANSERREPASLPWAMAYPRSGRHIAT
jgi:hypothetical protein